MNEQKPGIEWTHPYGRRGWTWNPTAGCLHGCTWRMSDGSVTECYAKTVAERLAQRAYPQGFEHHYWRPDALTEPLTLSEPAGIFVGSMADLFGHWVPEFQIRHVLQTMTDADWHIFQTLSKNPLRLPEFNPFPHNVWVGMSLPAGHQMKPEGAARALKAYLNHMDKVTAKVRFMSIEPLWFDVAPVFEEWLSEHDRLPFEWAILGAASNGPKLYPPDARHFMALMTTLGTRQIPIFFKGNMKSLPAARDSWYEEFPTHPPRKQIVSSFSMPSIYIVDSSSVGSG